MSDITIRVATLDDAAALLDPAKLEPEAFVRDMCAADRCHAYGRNWTCPPC